MSKVKETSVGYKGGLFDGPSHDEGGIPAIVTDTDTPIEVEGNEALINAEATALHWKELSEINQSAGNGVPIPPPSQTPTQTSTPNQDPTPVILTDTGVPIKVKTGQAIINKSATKKHWKELSEINQSAGNGVAIPNPADVSTEIRQKLEQGGKLTGKDRKAIFTKWKRLVNMTGTELEKYYNSADGETSGLTQKEADKQGIDSGRESARMIIKMKRTKVGEWTDDMWRWAGKQISFISRMRGVQGKFYEKGRKKTRKLKALLIWGHNPMKYKGSDTDFHDGGVTADKFFEDTEGHKATPQDKKVERPYRVRFHLGAGQNFMKWKVENTKTKNVKFFEPETTTIHMIDCRLVNSEATATKIFKGEISKTPIAWVECVSVDIEADESDISPDDRLAYNPRKSPNWNDVDGDNLDNYIFDELVTDKRSVYFDAPDGRTYRVGGLTDPDEFHLGGGSTDDIRFDDGGTLEFKAWFGNSKVVDKYGKPIVCYHGSPDLRGLKEDYIFKTINEKYGSDDKERAYFFTDNYRMARSYADPHRAFDYQNAEEGTISVYLSLQNPLIIDAHNQVWRKFETEIDGEKIIGTRQLIQLSRINGYDGVIVKNVRDYYNNNDKMKSGGNVYVTFEPTQIKLADGSNTTFDQNNPDIRFDEGGLIAPNGKPSNLTHEQYHLVRSPEFKAWFGDWENDPKEYDLLDENDEPKVWYHTGGDWTTLNDGGKSGKGKMMFSPTMQSMAYANESKDNTTRPFFIKCDYIYNLPYENRDKPAFYKWNNKKMNPIWFVNAYGGFIVVRQSNQIKLADGSNTTFDTNNPDIRYDQGGELIKRADGSYSRRGLWDNIRDNAGSGKKPTKEMLEQEAKIKSQDPHFDEGGKIDKALNDLHYAGSVKYYMEPEFSSEAYDFPDHGTPNSFVKTIGEGKNYKSIDIVAYDQKGEKVGLFSIATEGTDGNTPGAFKITTDPEKSRQGWGMKLLDEAHRQGIDIIGNIKKNRFSHSGRSLLRKWLEAQKNNIDKYDLGGQIQSLKNSLQYLQGDQFTQMEAYIRTLVEKQGIEDMSQNSADEPTLPPGEFDIDKKIVKLKEKYVMEVDTLLDGSTIEDKRQNILNWIHDKSKNVKVIIAFSGGKDSVAMVLQCLFKWKIPKDQIELWHHEVDGMGENLFDWKCTPSYCKAFAKAFGLKLLFSYAKGGILREMYKTNELKQPIYFQEAPDGEFSVAIPDPNAEPRTRRMFPAVSTNLTTRWCSSVAKIDVMSRAITNSPRFDNANIVIMTGERRAESRPRAGYNEIEKYKSCSRNRQAITWRSIIDMTEAEIWDLYKKHKIQPHPCYELGWGRCSCQLCIFGQNDAWASINEISPEKVERIAEIEKDLNYDLYNEHEKLSANPKVYWQSGPNEGKERYSKGRRLNGIYEARVDKGKSMIDKEKLKRWGAEALGEFISPIFVEKWELPAGAFSTEQSGAN